MSTFAISYPIGWNYGATFAEVDGRVTVHTDGEVEIEIEDIATGKYVALTGHDLAQALIWVRAERADLLREAFDVAGIGARQYSREMARV